MPNNVEYLLSRVVNLNGKTIANTALIPGVPAGNGIIITKIIVRAQAVTSISGGPTIGFGTAAGTSDIFAATAMALTTLSATYQAIPVLAKVVPGSGAFYLNLTNGATGTTLLLEVEVFGYFVV